MDSLSQVALGAAVGHAVGIDRHKRRSALLGAALGTLPDLDVFVPLGNDILDFTAHRSASHSLLLMALVTPAIVWGLGRIWQDVREAPWRWGLLVYLCLATHALLDSFTVYGTQMLWPLASHAEGWSHPVSWSTLFIIDPLYTLPLLVGVIAVLWRPGVRSSRLNYAGLALSSAYILFSIGAKFHVERIATESLEQQGIQTSHLMSAATPFNTVLWRVLVMADGHYWEGYRSLLDPDQPMTFTRYDGRHTSLGALSTQWSARRLAWFTHGFFKVHREGDELHISDLRMGFEPTYVFRFAVGRYVDGHLEPMSGEQRAGLAPTADALRWVWQRIWHPEIGSITDGTASVSPSSGMQWARQI